MNRLKIKDNSIIAILYVLLLNNNISILFVANNNNNSSILSHKSFIDLLSFLIVLTFFAWYIFLKIGRYFIFTSLAILLVNIQEIAPGPRILVKKYRCTSWSGTWRKRGPIFVSRWALLENIYLGANPVTLSRISRTEIGGGTGDTLFNVISFIDERDEGRVLSSERRKSLGERHANSFESFAHLCASSTLWARKSGARVGRTLEEDEEERAAKRSTIKKRRWPRMFSVPGCWRFMRSKSHLP